jgi:hypothetical protein
MWRLPTPLQYGEYVHTRCTLHHALEMYSPFVNTQEAKYVESWPSTTSAWAGWSRFDIPMDRYGVVYSLLICSIS